MRSFWPSIGRLQCHCHCYTCIEKRHVHVRKLFVTASRIRSGRLPDGSVRDGARSFSSQPRLEQQSRKEETEGWQTQDRRRWKGTWRVDLRSESFSRSISLHDHPRENNNRSIQLQDPAPVKDSFRLTRDDGPQEGTRTQENTPSGTEEQELREMADDLKSLSIDHWSLDDVVTFEPMPGGPRPPNVPSSTTADPNYMMPQSPWAPDTLKRQNYARVWTRKKIAKMETAVARFAVLVCRLLGLEGQRPSNLIVLPEAIRPFARLAEEDQKALIRRLTHRMKILANKGGYVAPNEPPEVPPELTPFMPRYEHYEDGLHHELLRDLNASLVELFDGYKKGHLDFLALMVKLSHNLLVSSAPPNVQTMNILLLGFYSCDKYLKNSASQVRHLILDWLINICLTVKIRPNEITCATILATYRRRGMRTAFTEFILLMRGTGGANALMFTKPLMLTAQSAPRLTPTADVPNVFKQSVYPSPMIFAEVIKGVAKFYSLQDAVDICKDFTAKEWGYDWSCLRYLLGSCIIQRDWESGLWVWGEIRHFRAMGHKEPLRVLAAMLALCVRCEEEAMFAEVLVYARAQLEKVTPAQFVDMATRILEHAIDRMDEAELLAVQEADEGSDTTDRGVYQHEAFGRRVQRRLDDDPFFRRAVFGLGTSIEDEERRLRYFDRAPDVSESYDFRRLQMDEDGGERMDVEDEIGDEGLAADGVADVGSGIDESLESDLMRDAEGGVDVEEVETPQVAEAHATEDASEQEHFGESPMETDGPLMDPRAKP